jgi:D-serine deaminase-like pyridoxal phosphate-dependent protein
MSAQSMNGPDGAAFYGEALSDWPAAERRGGTLVSLSQEHGVVSGRPQWIAQRAPGQVLYVLPVHSCLTCDLHGSYTTLAGDTLDRFSAPGRTAWTGDVGD